jgi:hypothetical protein
MSIQNAENDSSIGTDRPARLDVCPECNELRYLRSKFCDECAFQKNAVPDPEGSA